MSEYLRPADMAKEVKVSKSTVYTWLEGGHLPYYRFPGGGCLRVARADFEAFKEQWKQPVASHVRQKRRNIRGLQG